ncbi:MAG: zinc ABC transporter substrate-binding protein [Corynebacterium sp.]|nr:zinc ABC transporter substrate-binding protein [Corynebacterium sp.]
MHNVDKFPSRTSLRRSAVLGTFAVATLALAGCNSSGSSTEESTAAGSATNSAEQKIHIAASTSIWGDVAQAVADTAQGVEIEIEPIVVGNSIDPHDFEPSAAQIARAEEADIVVVGGGGYDSWLYRAMSDQDKIVTALPLVEHSHGGDDHDHADEAHADEHSDEHSHESEAAHASEEAHADEHADDHGDEHLHGEVEAIDGNEHIWYNPQAINVVAEEIAEHINELAPQANATADEVEAKVEALDKRLHALPAAHYAQTETLADYIMAHSEMTDMTPAKYRAALLNHGEPAAADLAAFLEVIRSGQIDLLVHNPQTETDLTDRIREAAEDENIAVVEIGETPPAGTNFFDYYDKAVDDLEAALSASK